MRTFIFSSKFLIVLSLTLPLMLCSRDDDSSFQEPQSFQPITIDLSTTTITIEDTEFTLQGFSFRVIRAISTALGGDGILLASPGENGEFSTLEMDLAATNGITKITISLFNNCSSCLDIQLINNNQIITEIKGTSLQSGTNEVEIDVSAEIDTLRIASLETIVNTIKLE